MMPVYMQSRNPEVIQLKSCVANTDECVVIAGVVGV